MCGCLGVALVHVAFGVGLRAHVLGALFRRVGPSLVQVGQGHRVLLVDVALKLGLQAGPLIVGEGQRDEGLGLTHKLVNVALPGHLDDRGEERRHGVRQVHNQKGWTSTHRLVDKHKNTNTV